MFSVLDVSVGQFSDATAGYERTLTDPQAFDRDVYAVLGDKVSQTGVVSGPL